MKLIQSLADSQIDWLESFTVSREIWFDRWMAQRIGIDELLIFIGKQTQLKLLNMHSLNMKEDQVEQIKATVTNPECTVIFTEDEYRTYCRAQ